MPYNRYYHWFSACDPDGILTHDLQNRNLTLYTAELRSHFGVAKVRKFIISQKAILTSPLFCSFN
jgi:hypothetical protein